MKIRRLNEDAKRFYVDEIVSAPGGKTETERHSFSTVEELKQYCKDAGLTKEDIANCGGCELKDLLERLQESASFNELTDFFNWIQDYKDGSLYDEFSSEFESVEDRDLDMDSILSWLESFDEEAYYDYTDKNESLNEDTNDNKKLHTKPNGEYLVKADSGKGYTAFSRDNVAIGGIDNEDADSDDKAIDKFKRNEYSECLNEEYFDTAEYRILKYEEDIPELMAGMHDDYMEGRLAAEFYSKALEKVYNALADCDHRYTLSRSIKTEDETIRDIFTEEQSDVDKYYAATYTSVDDSGNQTVKKICFRCDGTLEDAENEVDALIKEPYTSVKVFSCNKSMAVKDGFELVECTLNEDKETVGKFAQLAASHKFKNLKTQLEDADTCVTCQGKLLPEDNNGIRKCESCGNFYFGNQLLICTKCGSTEIDPGRDCKCRHCGYEFTEDHGKCVTCGGDIVKNDNETNKCQHCGNLYDVKTGELIKKKTNEAVEYDEDEVISAEEFATNTKMPRFSKLKAEVEKLAEKTGLTVYVSEPEQDGDNVDLWCSELFDIKGTGLVDVIELSEDESEYLFDSDAIEEHLVSVCLTDANEDDYDDDYSDDYDESLEECSGIKAHKVIMGEDIDDSIEFDDVDGVEGPEGDKTEDIEFVMDEYIAPDFLIDAVNKLSPTKYEVTYNGKTVLLEFDPKWSEYVYTINGKGPHSHCSYEWIISDIRDYVNTFCADEDRLDDDF